MTTKPKAKKFRIKRTGAATPTDAPAAARPVPPPPLPASPAQNGAFGGADMQSQTKRTAVSPGATGATEIEAIQKEGLTGRQLRLARRVAQKHDLPASSDYDAVRLLRQKGIDPFKRSNMLELVVVVQLLLMRLSFSLLHYYCHLSFCYLQQ